MHRVISNINKTANRLPVFSDIEHNIKFFSGLLSGPLGFFTVKANHVKILMRFGKFDGYRESGFRWAPLGVSVYETFLGDRTIKQNDMYITDSRGNPIIARTSVTFRVTNPLNSVINVNDDTIVENYFESKVRNTLSNYTYDEIVKNHDIFKNLTDELNSSEKIEEYGIEIQHSDLLDIKYSPEIANAMLMKQQAQSAIDARRYMIDNVIEIVKEIDSKMEKELSSENTARSNLAAYLAISMITDKSPQVVYDIR